MKRSELKQIIREVIEESKNWSKGADIKEGSMRNLLGVKKGETIEDKFDGDAEKAVKKLISKVGRDDASEKINYAANLDPDDNFLDKMQRALKRIKKEKE
jgi:hypothetical protein